MRRIVWISGMVLGVMIIMSGMECRAANGEAGAAAEEAEVSAGELIAGIVDENEAYGYGMDVITSNESGVYDSGENPKSADAGDGEGIIVTKTDKGDVNNAQVSFKAMVPEQFNLGVYVEIRNTDTGIIYRILATATNEYIGKMFVPEGEYEVIDCAVDGDIAMKYPMRMVASDDAEKEENEGEILGNAGTLERFVLERGGNAVLECTLVEFEEVQKEAHERVNRAEDVKDSKDENESVPSESEETWNGYYSAAEEVVYPWREVKHSGEGKASVKIQGVSNGVFDYVFVITATGKPGKGEFKYSVDGGINYSDVMVIPAGEFELTVPEYSGKRADISVGDETEPDYAQYKAGEKTGLKAVFTPGDEYLVYDEYRYISVREYTLKETGTQYGKGALQLSSSEEIYDAEYKFGLRIVKTGTMGAAEFEYTLDGRNWSDRVIVPENGEFCIPDTMLMVRFYVSEGGFVVGDEWSGEVKGSASKKEYGGIIIASLAFVAVLYLATVLYYASIKDKPEDYRINEYEPVCGCGCAKGGKCHDKN